MNLNRFIENLQNKPRVVRIQMLVGAVFICMLFVVWIWVASLNLFNPTQNGRAREASSGEMGRASNESTLKQLKEIGQEAFKSLEDFKVEFEGLEKVKQLEQEEVEPIRLPIE